MTDKVTLTIDSGGLWLITTRDSKHILDLENFLYRRFRGVNGRAMMDDGFERLDTLQPFTVGDKMKMTMAGGFYDWRVSSEVEAIEPYTGQEITP